MGLLGLGRVVGFLGGKDFLVGWMVMFWWGLVWDVELEFGVSAVFAVFFKGGKQFLLVGWMLESCIEDVSLSFCFAVLYEILCGRFFLGGFRMLQVGFSLGCFNQILDMVRCWHLEE